jgi:hypothetical protein
MCHANSASHPLVFQSRSRSIGTTPARQYHEGWSSRARTRRGEIAPEYVTNVTRDGASDRPLMSRCWTASGPLIREPSLGELWTRVPVGVWGVFWRGLALANSGSPSVLGASGLLSCPIRATFEALTVRDVLCSRRNRLRGNGRTSSLVTSQRPRPRSRFQTDQRNASASSIAQLHREECMAAQGNSERENRTVSAFG